MRLSNICFNLFFSFRLEIIRDPRKKVAAFVQLKVSAGKYPVSYTQCRKMRSLLSLEKYFVKTATV